MRVLVVDDEAGVRETTGMIIDILGHDVHCVESGDAAKQILTHKHFDIVVSDIRMPGSIGGFKLLDHIRRSYPTVPVILMSGWYDDIDMAACCRPRLPVLRKPFSIEDMEHELTLAVALIETGQVPLVSQDVMTAAKARNLMGKD